MTEAWSNHCSDHLQVLGSITDAVRAGGHAPDILTIGQLKEALNDSGFDITFLEDVAARSDTVSWYHLLPQELDGGVRHSLHWAWWTQGMSGHDALSAAAILANAGRAGVRGIHVSLMPLCSRSSTQLFTPMVLFVALPRCRMSVIEA